VTEILPNKGALGKAFKKEAKDVTEMLAKLSLEQITKLETDLAGGEASLDLPTGKTVTVTKDMVSVKKYQKTFHVEEFIPSVVEPSFGVGRVMYAIFEHNFKVREGDEARSYFTLPPVIAPLKCSVLPLSNNPDFTPLVTKLSQDLVNNDVSHKVDDSSGSIGKRYARTDEIAIPFGITVDFDSLKEPNTVTLRERDSTSQVRIGVEVVSETVRKLSMGRITWDEVLQKFPKFEAQETKSLDPDSSRPSKLSALKFDLGSEEGWTQFDQYLKDRSYLEGFTLSSTDLEHWKEVNRQGDKYNDFLHIKRWFRHVNTFN